MFKNHSVKQKKGKKDSLKSLHGKESNSSLSLPSEPSVTELPEFLDLPAGKKKLSWLGGGEFLNYGIFSGQSALCGNSVYFKNGGTSDIYDYNYSNKKWTRLPPTPHVGFSLAIIEGCVSAVGGFTPFDHADTDKILTYSSEMDGTWKEIYPPLPTARHYATTATSGSTLIVAGGSIRNNQRIATVEILDIPKRVWSRGVDLPLPISSPCSVLCGEDFYVLGGFSPEGKQSTVAVCCAVRDLIRSSTPASEKKTQVETRETYTLGFPWREIPDAPLTHTTCTSLNGSLVLVGGMKHSKKASGEVYRYDAMEFSWELIGVIPTPRYCSVSAVVPSSRELLVVGGLNGPTGCDCVNLLEVAIF